MSEELAANLPDRRQPTAHLSVADLLEKIPARSLMERLSIPLAAVSDDGDVLLANDAFAKLIGWTAGELAGATVSGIFHDAGTERGMLSFVAARAEQVIALCHRDGHLVHAKMTRSVLLRHDERSALVAFTDVSELRWLGGNSL